MLVLLSSILFVFLSHPHLPPRLLLICSFFFNRFLLFPPQPPHPPCLLLRLRAPLVWFRNSRTEALCSSSGSFLTFGDLHASHRGSPQSLRAVCREAVLLSSLSFILFSLSPPPFSPLASLRLPSPASVSFFPSEPGGSQTERVSRGLERNHPSAPPPSRSLSLTLHLCVYPPSSSPLYPLYRSPLHQHQQHKAKFFTPLSLSWRTLIFPPSMVLSASLHT